MTYRRQTYDSAIKCTKCLNNQWYIENHKDPKRRGKCWYCYNSAVRLKSALQSAHAQRILELNEKQITPKEIASIIADEGYRTKCDGLYSDDCVKRILKAAGKKWKREHNSYNNVVVPFRRIFDDYRVKMAGADYSVDNVPYDTPDLYGRVPMPQGRVGSVWRDMV